MSKAKNPTRKCILTGREFVYSGKGRPPKYHPDLTADERRRMMKADKGKAGK